MKWAQAFIVFSALTLSASHALEAPKSAGLRRGAQSRKLNRKDDGFHRELSKGKGNSKGSKGTAPPETDGLALCVVDERGFPIPEENPGYSSGLVIRSSIPEIEAGERLSETFETIGQAYGVVAGVAGVAALATGPVGAAAAAVAAAAGAAAAVWALASNIISKSEGLSDTEILIKNEFAKLNENVDSLRIATSFFFDQLRIDIADQTLDGLNNVLGRIAEAYRDYVAAATLNVTEVDNADELKWLQATYREGFRIACNELDFRPSDIISILYGHACGDPNNYPARCGLSNGANTGQCKFGIKQRAYLHDKFRLGEGTVARQREFKVWMLSTMMQSIFLQSVCLPPNQNSCPSENDAIFQANLEMSRNAMDETITIFNATEQECFCPCKYLRLKSAKVDVNDGLTGPSPEGKILIGVQRRGSTDKNYQTLVPRFDGKDTIEYDVRHPFVVTQADTLWFKVIEFDDFLKGGDDTYESSDPFENMSPTDWYDNKCMEYDVEYVSVHDDGDEITYMFTIQPVYDMAGDKCPENFCSDDKPDCLNADDYCEKDQYMCLPKKVGGESCTDPNQCLTGSCESEMCTDLLALEEMCSCDEDFLALDATTCLSVECESRFCGLLRFANSTENGFVCCPEDSGCHKCISEPDCDNENCARCEGGFCKYDCDFAACGPTCMDCTDNCFPDVMAEA